MFLHGTSRTWAAKEGPKKDSYNISDNPQYRLEIKTAQPAAIWVLLTRHITDKVRVKVREKVRVKITDKVRVKGTCKYSRSQRR